MDILNKPIYKHHHTMEVKRLEDIDTNYLRGSGKPYLSYVKFINFMYLFLRNGNRYSYEIFTAVIITYFTHFNTGVFF